MHVFPPLRISPPVPMYARLSLDTQAGHDAAHPTPRVVPDSRSCGLHLTRVRLCRHAPAWSHYPGALHGRRAAYADAPPDPLIGSCPRPGHRTCRDSYSPRISLAHRGVATLAAAAYVRAIPPGLIQLLYTHWSHTHDRQKLPHAPGVLALQSPW